MDEIIKARRYQVFFDEKWEVFVKRARLFHFIPFVEFVLGSGSMVYGNIRNESDFDVIVSVKKGRIFSARFFCILIFGLFGWRRKKLTHDNDAKDKICLNHFITKSSYRLSPPHNEYWKALYSNLVPLYGEVSAINNFFDKNSDWISKKIEFSDDLRFTAKKSNIFRNIVEWLLNGVIGDILETRLQRIQVSRIKRGLLSDDRNDRVSFTENELEFHKEPKSVNWDGRYWVWK